MPGPSSLRADRLVARRARSHRQHTRGHVWCAPAMCGGCRSTTAGSAEAILSGPFPEYDARISPDGQWLAYVSEETGRPEVSVRAMSGPPQASRGVQQRRQPTRLAPRWTRAALRRSRGPSSWPTGGTPTERRADARCGRPAARAAHRIGTLGHAVRRVARWATHLLHRSDTGAETEREESMSSSAGARSSSSWRGRWVFPRALSSVQRVRRHFGVKPHRTGGPTPSDSDSPLCPS